MGSVLQLLSEDISTIDGASIMVNGDFTQMDISTDCIGMKSDMFHATDSSGLAPMMLANDHDSGAEVGS